MVTKKPARGSNARVTPKSVPPSEASSLSDWKKKSEGALLSFPSGLRGRAKNPGMHVFVKNNMIPNALLPIVQKATNPVAAQKALEDLEVTPEILEQMIQLVDDITIFCMVEPRVYAAPENPDDRLDDRVYVDEIDEEDKQFLFQWSVGGTADVEQFRINANANVGSVQPS